MKKLLITLILLVAVLTTPTSSALAEPGGLTFSEPWLADGEFKIMLSATNMAVWQTVVVYSDFDLEIVQVIGGLAQKGDGMIAWMVEAPDSVLILKASASAAKCGSIWAEAEFGAVASFARHCSFLPLVIR